MPRDIPEGSILDEKYRLLFKIGEGGFGEVYLAEDTILQSRRVAIKSLKIDDPGREKLLIREMNFLADLNHPNVVQFFHHFRQFDSLFIVMEFCSGGSLWRRYRENKLRFEQVIGWAVELCGTLQTIHEKGVVHHDLKPENILFSDSGTIKIGDFGVANTRTGTVPFMAPELLLPTEQVSRYDARVDIYALGVTLLEILTGENPFLGMDDEHSLSAKIRLSFIDDSLPAWIREVLLKALQPKPELRFQTMQEFGEALESHHVPYVFDRNRIQAHKAALSAEAHLKKRRWAKALKLTNQALHQDPSCLSALITAGRCELSLKRVKNATLYFEKAIRINPRVSIQKELGWIYLESGRYPEAISMLNDHLMRVGADYEAYNLLCKTFYLTGRLEEALDLIEIVRKECRGNRCFENNWLVCSLLLDDSAKEPPPFIKERNPFVEYNWKVFTEAPSSWHEGDPVALKSKLLFQEFRFGEVEKWKKNTLVLENQQGEKWYSERPVVTVGRNSGNDYVLKVGTVSRRHCAIVNHADEVWLYDLGSTLGTKVDGIKVAGSQYLEGRHQIQIPGQILTIFTKEGILL